ncbi:MAG: transglycosylase domain-containing protein, partial [Myxococcales bacterium]|nr:transglycosylase domain-containing protein [Myxococcales bacterium]
LGGGNYGVQSASRDFFGKPVEELTLAEAAILAGLPKAPSEYSPHRHLAKALWRQRYVLQRMLDEGFITAEEAAHAQAQPIDIVQAGTGIDRIAPYFTEEIRQDLLARYGYDALFKEGLRVYTTLDPRLQRAANAAVHKGLIALDKRQGYHGVAAHLEAGEHARWMEEVDASLAETPLEVGARTKALVLKVDVNQGLDLAVGTYRTSVKADEIKWTRTDPNNAWALRRLTDVFQVGDLIGVEVKSLPGDPGEGGTTPPSPGSGGFRVEVVQTPEVQGALVAMNPRTGAILSMVGGYDFARSQFNRATQAVRQPGSAFKPIIYAAAMEHGFTPASIVIDAPIIYDDPGLNEVWKPQNFGRKFHGPTTLRDALTHSRNVVTIKVLREVGPAAA